jgi:dTDP-4-amino-4,6-dideoxygalactose transaminase
MKIPYINLGLQHQNDKAEILSKVSELLDSGMFILGEEVKKFEESFAKLCQTKYAVGVANGTDALMLAMRSLGISKGDEVITAPNSYLASASSIELIGATAVFADVRDDFNLDPVEVEKKITAKTKAIIAVHLTGRPADMDALNVIAKKHNIYVIEDSAQAVGAKLNNKPTGGLGFIGCFSLHPLKNLAAIGDAGIITTNDLETYNWLLKARTHGMKSRDECEFWSLNSRLDAVQAAILNIKIKNLEAWTKRRRLIAERYIKSFGHLVHVPIENENEYSVYHTFIIQTEKRDELMGYLSENGVDAKIHYPIAIHQQEAAGLNSSSKDAYPITEKQIESILTLPVYPELTDSQVNYICEIIIAFFK